MTMTPAQQSQANIGKAGQHESLLNAEAPRGRVSKPTRLYVLDVMARAQRMGMPQNYYSGWVPSGVWRVYWKTVLLVASTFDVTLCSCSVAFCQQAYGVESSSSALNAAIYWLVQIGFAFDMWVHFRTAVVLSGGLLELNRRRIAIRYLRSTFVLDLLGLLPLELCIDDLRRRRLISWQWMHLPRWFIRWYSYDDFTSITNTEFDKHIAFFKCSCHSTLALHTRTCFRGPGM